jgi:cell division protein FtsB
MKYVDPIKKYFVSGLLIFLSVVFIRSSINSLGRSKRLTVLKQEVDLLKEQRDQLEEDIDYKQTEEYIEERARNDLNLVKPDEKIFVIVDDNASANSEKEVLSVSSKREMNDSIRDETWYMWYRLFFDN